MIEKSSDAILQIKLALEANTLAIKEITTKEIMAETIEKITRTDPPPRRKQEGNQPVYTVTEKIVLRASSVSFSRS